jgi:cupin 2 domain-containing protein
MKAGNLYQQIPDELPREIAECLLSSKNVRIERIISRSHKSETDFWYDQAKNEWVLLLEGEAGLRFKDNDEVVRLVRGMYINIPAHVQHRVEWTAPDRDTIWLVVFYC